MPFVKGQSGNPGGRPKVPNEVRELARAQTKDAIKTLTAVMKSAEEPAAARVSAANSLLDRGWGKANQPVTGGDDDDNPINIITRIERVIVRGEKVE